jgi:hypothetical protein
MNSNNIIRNKTNRLRVIAVIIAVAAAIIASTATMNAEALSKLSSGTVGDSGEMNIQRGSGLPSSARWQPQ